MSTMKAAAILLVALTVSACGTVQSGETSTYQRPPAVDAMPLQHPRLARHKSHPHAPEQVHVSLAGPSAVTIAWVTHPHEDTAVAAPAGRGPGSIMHRLSSAVKTATSATGWPRLLGSSHNGPTANTGACAAAFKAAGIQSVVQIGPQPGRYDANVTAGTGSQRCYEVSDYHSGALHHVTVGSGDEGPLDPMATYYYRVGDPELGWSEEFNFTLPRESHQNGGFPYRLGLIGDLGQTENSAQTLEHLIANKPDSILNVGDLSYADGEQPRWDSFGRLVQPVFATIPHMPTEGNHEKESIDGGPEDFVAYTTRYEPPYRRSGSDSPLYYSYETGPAHIIMLGTYADGGKDSEQVAWLKRDLASVDRSRTPWLIVGMHAPWYNSNQAHQQEAEDMRQAMEPLLYSYGVDLVFAGHVHAYERSERVFDWKEDKCGAVHVVIGDGGNREGLASNYLKQPAWSAMREASYGHATLDFEDATTAIFRWHRNQDGAAVTADEMRFQRRTECDGHLSSAFAASGLRHSSVSSGRQSISSSRKLLV